MGSGKRLSVSCDTIIFLIYTHINFNYSTKHLLRLMLYCLTSPCDVTPGASLSMGDFTFWLNPWLRVLAEPKTRLSRR